jgi:hydroxyethylthiazole kinase
MARVTGSGCSASALTGAFAAVNAQPFEAAVNAMALSGIAGEMAAQACTGPGSYQVHFLDVLHGLTGAQLQQKLRLA